MSEGLHQAEAERTLRWKLITITELENKRMRITFPGNDESIASVLSEEANELIWETSTPGEETVNAKDWVVVKVLPRGRDLYDHSQFDKWGPKKRVITGTMSKNLHELISILPRVDPPDDDYWDDGFDEERIAAWEAADVATRGEKPEARPKPTVVAAYVGWSTYMSGPVLVKPTRKDKDGRLLAKAEVESFSWRGNSFTVQPTGSSAGRQTIPHYLMTIPANLKAIKKWTDGQDFCEVYKNGGRSLGEIRRSAFDAATALRCGMEITPVAKFDALPTSELMRLDANPDRWSETIRPDEQEGPTNPRMSELACDAAILRRELKTICGFQYKVPYIRAMRFPPQLLDTLMKFAMQFPEDLLTMDLLLLALMAWADIKMAPESAQELSVTAIEAKSKTDSEAWPVPKVSLAECLVLYPHWLRWVEVMKFAEYPHLFRYVRRVVDRDRKRSALVIKEDLLDETQVLALLQGVRSKSPALSTTARFYLLPHQMPGSCIPAMRNMSPYIPLTKAQIVLSGLPNVYSCGTPGYGRLDTPSETPRQWMCIPTQLENISFVDGATPLSSAQWNIDHLLAPHSNMPIVFAPKMAAGPIWSADMSRQGTMLEEREDTVLRGPSSKALDPDWSISDVLGPEQLGLYHRYLRAALARVIEDGGFTLTQKQVIVGLNGLPVVVGAAPLSIEDLRREPPIVFGGEDAEAGVDPQTVVQVCEEEAPGEGASHLFEDIRTTLSATDELRHYIWTRVRESLDASGPPQRTATALLALLGPPLQIEKDCWDTLNRGERDLSLKDLQDTIDSNTVVTKFCQAAGVPETVGDPLLYKGNDTLSDFLDEVKSLKSAWSRLDNCVIGNVSSRNRAIADRVSKVKERWRSALQAVRPGSLIVVMEGYVQQLRESVLSSAPPPDTSQRPTPFPQLTPNLRPTLRHAATATATTLPRVQSNHSRDSSRQISPAQSAVIDLTEGEGSLTDVVPTTLTTPPIRPRSTPGLGDLTQASLFSGTDTTYTLPRNTTEEHRRQNGLPPRAFSLLRPSASPLPLPRFNFQLQDPQSATSLHSMLNRLETSQERPRFNSPLVKQDKEDVATEEAPPETTVNKA
ncbi:hypothetical protein CCMA1212_001158 [Trichoderma ghanense]|uniref:Uncharacterized protein n=1 Tax=Trichoderma ghanense TaxID=65468 RepID=A0ABY2HLS3_9HYPO